jgi:hypothetical protein
MSVVFAELLRQTSRLGPEVSEAPATVAGGEQVGPARLQWVGHRPGSSTPAEASPLRH